MRSTSFFLLASYSSLAPPYFLSNSALSLASSFSNRDTWLRALAFSSSVFLYALASSSLSWTTFLLSRSKSANLFFRASISVLKDFSSSSSLAFTPVRLSLAILTRSISLPILTTSWARALESRSAFSYRLVISFSLTARSLQVLSEEPSLAVSSLITTWLCSKSLTSTPTSEVSFALAFSAAFSFCSRALLASFKLVSSRWNFFLRASTSSTRRRASFSYFFFQSAFSACHLLIEPSRLILTCLSSSISTIKVLMFLSRAVILVSAALRCLVSWSAALLSSSIWVANLFLSMPACSMASFMSFSFLFASCASNCNFNFWAFRSWLLLFRLSIFTLYSFTVISSFSTTFFMLTFSDWRISICAYSSEISVFMTPFSFTTFSLSLDILSICSCSSIMLVWCLVLKVWICCSDSVCTSSKSFLSLAISASLFLLMSSCDSEPDSASVRRSDKEMICIWRPCFSCS